MSATQTNIIPTITTTPIRVEYIRLGIKVGTNQTTRKLAEAAATQTVRRAVNAWLYSRD